MTDKTDIVERLRSFAQGCRGSMWQSRDETIRLMDSGADEIERLRRALRRLASPEAFVVSRRCTEEETARMKYAQAILDGEHELIAETRLSAEGVAALNGKEG